MDILPRPKPNRPAGQGPSAAQPVRPTQPVQAVEPVEPLAAPRPTPKPSQKPTTPPVPYALRRPWYKKPHLWIFIALGLFVVGAVAAVSWYFVSLRPVDPSDSSQVRVVIESGDGSAAILSKLKEKNLIHSELAARIYVDLSGAKNKLQAGGYVLTRQQDVADIVEHLSSGKTDEINVTILPGLTLKDLADSEVKGSLAAQGFSKEEIEKAFNAKYSSPLLADKPAGQGLEGYIFPETYRMNAGAGLETVIQRSLDDMYKQLQTKGMIDKFKSRGLNIHQAVTLASIVQEEVSDPATQKQVAQVFYKRLSIDMVLGSDVTFEYAAAQLGVTPAVDIDSPYNTRQVKGLPPGPIANMNISALEAVADPAPGDYLFFVAGDDGVTYFSRTVEEHEANAAAHCKKLCNLY